VKYVEVLSENVDSPTFNHQRTWLHYALFGFDHQKNIGAPLANVKTEAFGPPRRWVYGATLGGFIAA
jgi:hypothetical protein